MTVATALLQQDSPSLTMVETVVRRAMKRAQSPRAEAILLFVTSDFAHDLPQVVHTAARTGQTLQVHGCSAIGVMTEEDWVIDGPAVAAMVWADEPGLTATHDGNTAHVALAAPNAINRLWLESPNPRYGGVSGDATGHGPYTVWGSGRMADIGHIEAGWAGYTADWHLSQALTPLSAWQTVTASQGFDLLHLDSGPAADGLLKRLAQSGISLQTPHLLAWLSTGDAVPVLNIDLQRGAVSLARPLALGEQLRWALRTEAAALADLQQALSGQAPPDFMLHFASAGRGPNLHQGRDAEWDRITRHFPDTPLIGFYGNGEI